MSESKVILISGAGTGIGAACALEFARAGYAVAGFGRRAAPLYTIQEKVERAGAASFFAEADTTDEAAVGAFVERASETLGGIDVAFANAGIAKTGHLAGASLADLREQIDINLAGAFVFIKAALPYLADKRGRIFVNTSMAASRVYKDWGFYSATKAGLSQMIRIWREEIKDSGVRFTEIAVGATDTPIWDEIRPGKDRSYMIDAESVARLMLEVAMQPEQVSTEEIKILPSS